jgi:hypothetical protein
MRVNEASLYELRIAPRALNFGLGRYPTDSCGSNASMFIDERSETAHDRWYTTNHRSGMPAPGGLLAP